MASDSGPAIRAARRFARRGRNRAERDGGLLFRREGTELNPVSTTNRKLVISGPFSFTRNPMYLGLVIATLGIAFWVGAWPMFLAPIAVFATTNWVHIPFEEAKMRRQFGAEYDAYVSRVRRWI
jgi:protein-S-isoprenylcysteine O-methyltransferase Ste14